MEGIMKRFLLPVMVMIFCCTGIISAEVLIKPNDTNINYYGRFDFSNSSTSVSFNWPGSVIEATFPGPSIGVELNDGSGSYFNVEIDGVLVDSLSPTTTTHRTIRTNLSTANHTIRITLRTNGLNCTFGGFYLADGKTLVARPVKPTRKMEFIGDSWTAGDVVGQTTTPSSLKYFNASLTYARLTSIAYHAQDMLIARGGCGLVKSNSSAATMPTRYLKTLCDGTANWSFTSWTPDVVVIFLGINDFNNSVTDSTFVSTYKTFISTVRGHYTNVPIILIGLTGGTILTDVQKVAKSFTGITVFSSPITLSNAHALWQHPNPAQHRLISDSLIPVVKKAVGWDTALSVGVVVADVKLKTRYNRNMIVTTSQDKIVFPASLSGASKELIAYDCRGQALRKLTTEKQTVFLSRDFGLPPGMYVIKTNVLR
jgi:hypothetical protein